MDATTPLHCHVEIPKGSRNKYEWDEGLQAIKLNRFLFASVVYPTDYGFIPETIGPKDEALDAMEQVEIQGWEDSDVALEVIAEGRRRYAEERS
jgi:inorganic pyrophosphatase